MRDTLASSTVSENPTSLKYLGGRREEGEREEGERERGEREEGGGRGGKNGQNGIDDIT